MNKYLIVVRLLHEIDSLDHKASERPSDYHPSCGLTSGSSIVDNDELAQKECSRMMTTDIFLKISW